MFILQMRQRTSVISWCHTGAGAALGFKPCAPDPDSKSPVGLRWWLWRKECWLWDQNSCVQIFAVEAATSVTLAKKLSLSNFSFYEIKMEGMFWGLNENVFKGLFPRKCSLTYPLFLGVGDWEFYCSLDRVLLHLSKKATKNVLPSHTQLKN